MRSTCIGRIFVAALLATAACTAYAKPPASTSTGDAQDLVFLGERRPTFIRLHILVDNNSFRQVWEDFLTALFDYLDLDGDGVLNEREVERAPQPAFLLQLLRGNGANMPDPNARPSMDIGVTLVGGRVKREGLATYYRLSGIDPFVMRVDDRSTYAESLTDALFKHLDLDGDGKLSREELRSAARSLRKLDLNDDEMISVTELLPNRMDASPAMRMRATMAESPLFIAIAPQESSARFVLALLARYDKDKNEKLSPAEIGLERSLFARLDKDRDGELDAKELAMLFSDRPVDVEITVRLGSSPPGVKPVEAICRSPNANLTITRETRAAGLQCSLGDMLIQIAATGGPALDLNKARDFIQTQFRASDRKNTGYLTQAQIGENQLLRTLFPLADRDGDGKVSWQELSACIDMLAKAASSSIELTVTDHGRGLFGLLNSHQDDRLRQADLLEAWTKLERWDAGRKGYIDRAELPYQFQLGLNRAQTVAGFSQMVGSPLQLMALFNGRLAGRGPAWFQRMDRNGDGFVSLREFLGSKEDFMRIDTNGDGLISVEEAERADAELRKAKSDGK
jgi:Ca2+-binding EF-hand superfamily protein